MSLPCLYFRLQGAFAFLFMLKYDSGFTARYIFLAFVFDVSFFYKAPLTLNLTS